jgi:hypothetical protein
MTSRCRLRRLVGVVSRSLASGDGERSLSTVEKKWSLLPRTPTADGPRSRRGITGVGPNKISSTVHSCILLDPKILVQISSGVQMQHAGPPTTKPQFNPIFSLQNTERLKINSPGTLF